MVGIHMIWTSMDPSRSGSWRVRTLEPSRAMDRMGSGLGLCETLRYLRNTTRVFLPCIREGY